MTKLTYTCKTAKGNIIKVGTYVEALRIKENGGTITRTYEPIEEPFKVKPDRFNKLREKGVLK